MTSDKQHTKHAEKPEIIGFHSYVNQNCIIDRMRSGCYNICTHKALNYQNSVKKESKKVLKGTDRNHHLSVFYFRGFLKLPEGSGAFFLGHPWKGCQESCQAVTGAFCVHGWNKYQRHLKKAVRGQF